MLSIAGGEDQQMAQSRVDFNDPAFRKRWLDGVAFGLVDKLRKGGPEGRQAFLEAKKMNVDPTPLLREDFNARFFHLLPEEDRGIILAEMINEEMMKQARESDDVKPWYRRLFG